MNNHDVIIIVMMLAPYTKSNAMSDSALAVHFLCL